MTRKKLVKKPPFRCGRVAKRVNKKLDYIRPWQGYTKTKLIYSYSSAAAIVVNAATILFSISSHKSGFSPNNDFTASRPCPNLVSL
jgi:hypothetical protein